MSALPWGKCDDEKTHHLAHHCADVAACFETLVDLPVIRSRFEFAAGRALGATDIARLAVLAFLHDCGKLHPGFQAKGWPKGVWKDFLHGHVQEGAAIFEGVEKWQIARNLQLERMTSWGVNANLVFAVLSHHGRPFHLEPAAKQRWKPVDSIGYAPVPASAEIGKLLPVWFPEAFQADNRPLPINPCFQHFFCGLVSLADWLGSERRVFDFVAELDIDYMAKARELAKKAAIDIGLDVRHWRENAATVPDLFAVLTSGKRPREAQKLIGDWSLDDNLIILEAETGSGKTEAALWRFAALFAAGLVDGLYFALPTRAAAKQIQGRVDGAVKRILGPQGPEAVLAVPGYLRSGETKGRALPDFKVLWDDDAEGERKGLARWSAESAKRYLAATIAVGTVDQAMLAALQVKHAHLRGATLARSLLVIDEVHASDRYMTEVQQHLLAMHLARGGYAMLMSATLGSTARTRWLHGRRIDLPSLEEAVATPYPAVWGGSAGICRPAKSGGDGKAVAMSLSSSWTPDVAADAAIAAARAGARVLVIRNTVTAAIATVEAVMNGGGADLVWQVAGGPALHHSRFAPEDRALLDAAVEAALPTSEDRRDRKGLIVIGTQTLEQSLDIDADFLVTDLCPVDVLLQRIGRLHRHRLPRPAGFETPRCFVLAPEGGLDRLVAPAFENGLGKFKDGGGVYRNLHACELTRQLILDRDSWRIPEMNRVLVESATHDDPIEALNREKGPAWRSYWNDINGRELAEAGGARRIALEVTEPFLDEWGNPRLFLSDEEKIRTRLGAEGARIDFESQVAGPFGSPIGNVVLPAHWSRGIAPRTPVRPSADGAELMFSVDDRTFRYGRYGLERKAK